MKMRGRACRLMILHVHGPQSARWCPLPKVGTLAERSIQPAEEKTACEHSSYHLNQRLPEPLRSRGQGLICCR